MIGCRVCLGGTTLSEAIFFQFIADEVVIDVEAGIPPTTSAQSTTPTANIPSPTQSAETANTNSINSNNGSGDERKF